MSIPRDCCVSVYVCSRVCKILPCKDGTFLSVVFILLHIFPLACICMLILTRVLTVQSEDGFNIMNECEHIYPSRNGVAKYNVCSILTYGVYTASRMIQCDARDEMIQD